MDFARTILKDIKIEALGTTFSHEHIVIDHCFATEKNDDFLLNDFDKITEELLTIKQLGCQTVVDTMPVNSGRNIILSANISEKTGINIIIPTGIHLEKYYPKNHWRYSYSEDQLTQLFVDDIKIGIDKYDYNGPIVERTNHKAGLIKLATGDEPISKHQEKIFNAVVNAHKITGAPILTHTNAGKHAIAQAEMFAKLGANLQHIVLSHVDQNKDISYHKDLMQMGINVEYDSHFRIKNDTENWTYSLLEQLLPDHPTQITAGMDAARNTYWKSYGGNPGLAYLLTNFIDQLKKRDIFQFFENIFVKNPAKIFSFSKNN
jgi:5-phospho-D-xylono-1,4-lactonase